MKKGRVLILSILISAIGQAFAADKTVDVYRLNDNVSAHGIGEKIGTIEFKDSPKGMVILPNLKGLTPGDHGFHIHQNPSCELKEKNNKNVPGLAAGGHLDPEKTKKHLGPFKAHGHLGDLPVLVANKKGESHHKMLAPHLKVAEVENHSIMIHKGGDNYSDYPKPLGGGGPRIACGVIK
ncbi:MAG: superoxide dismutase [Cu-Zn] SodC [Candidatus Berkiellales bacterium]